MLHQYFDSNSIDGQNTAKLPAVFQGVPFNGHTLCAAALLDESKMRRMDPIDTRLSTGRLRIAIGDGISVSSEQGVQLVAMDAASLYVTYKLSSEWMGFFGARLTEHP
jgi:hypothetical protein